MTGQDFERCLVNGFNSYFEVTGIRAYAYRNKQFRYVDQIFDIFVDSRRAEMYLAFECKSVDSRRTPKLYWSQHFHGNGDTSQIARETNHLIMTGRNGFLAVEGRKGPGKVTCCWLIPWKVIHYKFSNGETGIWSDEIIQGVCIQKKKGVYEVTQRVIDEMIERMDGVDRRFVRKEYKGRVY